MVHEIDIKEREAYVYVRGIKSWYHMMLDDFNLLPNEYRVGDSFRFVVADEFSDKKAHMFMRDIRHIEIIDKIIVFSF